MIRSNSQDAAPAAPPWITRRGSQFLLLVLGATAGIYARFTISPLQETLRTALSLSDNQMALLQGPALALPMAAAALPLGLLIDRYVRVRLLLIFGALNLLGTLATAFSSDFTMLFVSRAIVGLAGTVIATTSFSLLADLYPAKQRGRATMAVVIGQYAGMSAAFALGGMSIAMSPGADGWRQALLWLSAPLGAVLLLGLFLREPERAEIRIAIPSARGTFAALWGFRGILAPLVLGLAMAEVSVLAVLTWGAPALSRAFLLSPADVGAIVAMSLVVSGVIGPIGGGLLADRCQNAGGPARTMLALAGLALLGVPTGLFAMAPSETVASALLILFMIVIGATLVTGITIFTVVIPNELRGLCMAILAGAQVLFGVALAPMAVSWIATAAGGPMMIGKALALVCVVASLICTACFLFGRRKYMRFPQ